ncbi:MAG TPA: response regulator, partial [Nitrospirales bacterium]|nr:response regulator [Nitrospirales bacterium]
MRTVERPTRPEHALLYDSLMLMKKPRILIVDDDPALLEALPDTVRARLDGVTVETCASGKMALELASAIEYDAIVSDIKMPDMDGLDLLARVKLLRPDIPMLLITGHGDHDLAVRALRGGAYDFIHKPIERDYFIASLVRAVQTRQLRQQIESQKAALARHATELEEMVHERTQELEAAQRRLTFLSDASRALAASLDYTATLQRLAQLVVPTLADYCVVSMLDDHGGFRRIAVAHRDASQEE